jgi:hypothetical protein
VENKCFQTNDDFEYYYVYYDEEGNVLDKSPSVAATTIASENKLQVRQCISAIFAFSLFFEKWQTRFPHMYINSITHLLTFSKLCR